MSILFKKLDSYLRDCLAKTLGSLVFLLWLLDKIEQQAEYSEV